MSAPDLSVSSVAGVAHRNYRALDRRKLLRAGAAMLVGGRQCSVLALTVFIVGVLCCLGGLLVLVVSMCVVFVGMAVFARMSMRVAAMSFAGMLLCPPLLPGRLPRKAADGTAAGQ